MDCVGADHRGLGVFPFKLALDARHYIKRKDPFQSSCCGLSSLPRVATVLKNWLSLRDATQSAGLTTSGSER